MRKAIGGDIGLSDDKLSPPLRAAFNRTGKAEDCAALARCGGRRSGAVASAPCRGCSGSGVGCASAMCGRASSNGADGGGRIGAARAAGGAAAITGSGGGGGVAITGGRGGTSGAGGTAATSGGAAGDSGMPISGAPS